MHFAHPSQVGRISETNNMNIVIVNVSMNTHRLNIADKISYYAQTNCRIIGGKTFRKNKIEEGRFEKLFFAK